MMQLLSVMHVIDTLLIGGKERMLVEVANQSIKSGMQVSVCVTRAGDVLSKELESSIPVKILNRDSTFDLGGFQRFLSFSKEQKPDIFHAHGRSSFAFLAFLKAMKQIAAPIILHDHLGIELDSNIPLWFRLCGNSLVDRYVGVYTKLADWAQRAGISTEKISVIENAIDLHRFNESHPLDLHKEFHVDPSVVIGVVVGRICQEKGVDQLLRVVSQLTEKTPVVIIWVGPVADDGYYQQCMKHYNHNQGVNVHFVGERIDIPSLLKGADFALLPSRSESGPIAIIEYIASGLPFVAFQVGGICDQLAGLGLPGFVPPGNIQMFVRNVENLLELSQRERFDRGKTGKELVHTHFDLSRIMQQWYDLYWELKPKQRI
jgi:glycosyltransferase involved in cell wall biosynthesis